MTHVTNSTHASGELLHMAKGKLLHMAIGKCCIQAYFHPCLKPSPYMVDSISNVPARTHPKHACCLIHLNCAQLDQFGAFEADSNVKSTSGTI
jgi:hypothetical protein